jgi:Eukaryotic protein of unknown function (DUF829)
MPPKNNTQSYLENFQHLGNGILVYEPGVETPHSPSKVSPPSLIILTTWFSALPRHISKYTANYRTLFPNSSLLILQSSIPDMVYRSYSIQQQNLSRVLPILQQHQSPDHDILLHAFSNSGAHTACQLARAYQSHTGKAFQVGALILDSAPGMDSFEGMKDGFIGGLPTTPGVRAVLKMGVYGLVGAVVLKERVLREENWIRKMRGDLNDRELLNVDRGRVYVYSEGDRVVGWRDVESHASEAKGRTGGEDMGLELWHGSGHVGHMFRDGDRYWEIVRKVWEGETLIRPKL